MKTKILLTSLVLLNACSTSTPTYQNYQPPAGYEHVTTGTAGHKWYYAPASVQPTTLRGRDPQTGQLEAKNAKTVSIMILQPNPWYPPIASVEALACAAIPGTYFKQKADKRGWDTALTTEPHGTARWQIWQKVCT